MNPTRAYLSMIARKYGRSGLERVYRQLAIKWHPDQGGDPVRFKELQEAVEAVRFLCLDTDRRKM